jgi:hypothetical protein
VVLIAHSTIPHFLRTTAELPSVHVYTILSITEQLIETHEFIYGSMADSCGLIYHTDQEFQPLPASSLYLTTPEKIDLINLMKDLPIKSL